MPELPSGTVSFLFTDIEGSTRLLQHLREGYGEVLADHHRLLRAAFEEAGGQEIGTEGDAFFVAFRTARDVVTAAAAAQRALAGHPWPEGGEVRVRMGIHTGEPAMDEEGYRGMALHRAARISAAGHGGQVLLSNATRQLVEDDLPSGLGLRDLGEQRLKDLERPEQIFQLTIDGLRNDFPPLKTLAAPRRSTLRRLGVLAAVLGAVAAALAILLFGRGGSGSGVAVSPNSVAVIDPKTNRVVDAVPVGARPGAITSGFRALWVANVDDRSVSRIDLPEGRAVKAIATDEAADGLAAGEKAVWAIGSSPARQYATVRRIDPEFDQVVGTTKVPGSTPGGATGAIAVGEGAVWAAPGGLSRLARIDPRTNKVVATIEAGVVPSGVAVGGGGVWVTDVYGNAVIRVDPKSNILVETIRVGQGPTAVAYGAGAVWVAASLDDSVARIDPATNSPAATIAVGDLPAGIAVGEGAVWVANAGDGTVSRIDPKTNKVVETIETGGSPFGVAVAGGRVWVTVAAEESASPAVVPGTARLEALADAGTLDPALASDPLSFQLEYATCAKLLNYPDKPTTSAGLQLEPEVALAQPVVSADRRTYTFTIRPGFRFSPPSNETVTARTFKYAIERSLSPTMRGPASGSLRELVGAEAFEAGTATHISGLVAQGSKLTLRLTEPVPDLPARLALPYFCAVPINTPIDPGGVRTVPSAGPYYVASYVPAQMIVLKRNPRYGGRRPHELEEIRVSLSVAPAQSLVDVEAGRADYVLDGVPREAHARLSARYGPGSAAAKAGKQQYFVNPGLGVDFLVLNAHRPLFANVRLRRAVNYAVDRRALAPNDAFALGQPADHYLPPAMPGFQPARIYPLSPDVAKARKLARGGGEAAVLYTCELLSCRQLAEIVKENLGSIGIDVEVEAFPIPALLARLVLADEPFDIALFGHTGDVADPGIFLEEMLALPVLDLRGLGRKAAAAERLTGHRRELAIGRLANDLARDSAPLVAFANPLRQDFFSRRMGCQIFNPLYGIDLAALCIRR